MNIRKLNSKLRFILEVFNIIQRDQLKSIQNSYIGIHQDYLLHQVIKYPNLFNINYTEAKQSLINFFKMLNENQIKPLVILQHHNHHTVNTNQIVQCQIEKNQTLFNDLLYKDSVQEALIPQFLLINWLQELQIQYLVVPEAGPQLRYLYTNNLISGILSEISFLEHCFSFKELNYLIIGIFDNSFEWIEIKQLTAKSQLSLDSLSELYQLHDYCTIKNMIAYQEPILNQFSNQKFNKLFSELNLNDQFSIIYNIGQTFFAGKLTFVQRLQKFPNYLIDSNLILAFIQSVKDYGYIDLNFDEMRLSIPQNYVQYPTEVLLFQSFGLCQFNKNNNTLLTSFEQQEQEFFDAQQLAFEKLNIGYCQGKNLIKSNFSVPLIRESFKNPTLHRSVHYYYKTLKIKSRKTSFDMGEQCNMMNQDLIQLNLNLRFLHNCDLLNLEVQKGSLYASALSYSKPQYFVPFFLYLKLLESSQKQLLYSQMYNPLLDKDDEIVKLLNEKKNEGKSSNLFSLQVQEEKDERILLLLRFFIINSNSQTSELDQFSDFMNKICRNYADIYDALLMGLYFEINQRNLLENFIELGLQNPFKRKFCYSQEFYQFLKQKISKQEFMIKNDIQHYINCWNEFLKLFDYINQKQGMRFDMLSKANELFQQLIK